MPIVALALWTLFVWGVRIRNADGDFGPTLLSLSFVAFAVVVLVQRIRRRPLRLAVLALSAWTAAVWLVRVADIVAFSDHGAGFVIVHTALAVVSVGLAWAAQRHVQGEGQAAAAAPRLEELRDG